MKQTGCRSPRAPSFPGSINFFVRTEVDQQQHFRSGLGVFLSGKNNPAVVAYRTGVESI